MIPAYTFKRTGLLTAALYVVVLWALQACNQVPDDVNDVLARAGKNRAELEKVIAHYKKDADKQKIKAAYYLIKHMADQYHYTGETIDIYDHAFNQMDSLISTGRPLNYTATWDTLQPRQKSGMRKVRDIHVVTAAFLIENIERSFQAWQYPWARELSFDEFCNYILPYKLRNEKPENWKGYFQTKYRWLTDSLKQNATYVDACIRINQEMARWFYITKLKCPFDLSFTQIDKIKSGRCSESTQMAGYAMRSMGIPVVLEHVPVWANRNSGHDWNGLILKDKTIPFLGTEIDPGLYKIEFPMPGSLRSKRAKVFRQTFEVQRSSLAKQSVDLGRIPKFFRDPKFNDVTREYVPVADATIQLDTKYLPYKTAYLCVFNSLKWEPVFYGNIESEKVTFSNMGMGIVYLPAVFDDGNMIPAGLPFILDDNGTVSKINADKQISVNISIDKKYPVNEDNEIQPGEKYELFYWDNNWMSLGVKTPTGASVEYAAPEGALLWIHKINKGIEERIFTFENGQQIWW
jgi:hypothetical protein